MQGDLRGIYFIDPEDMEFEEIIKNARRKLETPMAPAMPCKTCKKNKHGETRSKTNDFKCKFACISEASESTRMRMEETLPKYHEDHIAGKGDNSLQHYNMVPRGESFPIPLKYIDVTRATSTTLDVMLERPVDDYRNIEGNRDISDSWTGFTRFTSVDEKTADGYTWSGRRLTKKQTTPRPDYCDQRYGKTCQKQRNKKKNKNALSKNRSLTTLEDCAVFTSLIQRMQSSKKLLKTRGSRCQQQRSARSGEERTTKLVAFVILSRQNTHASLKPTNLRESVWKELYKKNENHIELCDKMGKNAKLKEKQKWSREKLYLENARKLRGIYFIDPEDKEFK